MGEKTDCLLTLCEAKHQRGALTMKNTLKILKIIFITVSLMFSMAACGSSGGGGTPGFSITVENTVGKIDITGLDKHDGSYIIAFERGIFSASGINATNASITAGSIVDGKASLKVWTMVETSDTSGAFKNFKESGTQGMLAFIVEKPTLTAEEMDLLTSAFASENMSDFPGWFVDIGFVEADFKNGVGDGEFISWSDFLS